MATQTAEKEREVHSPSTSEIAEEVWLKVIDREDGHRLDQLLLDAVNGKHSGAVLKEDLHTFMVGITLEPAYKDKIADFNWWVDMLHITRKNLKTMGYNPKFRKQVDDMMTELQGTFVKKDRMEVGTQSYRQF